MDRAGEPGEGLVRRESEKGETGRPRPFFFDFWSAWWGWIFASPAVDFFSLARRGPQPSCWRQAVSWRLCRLETAGALWVLCRLGWGVTLAGKTYFSFVGKRRFFILQLVFACSDGVYLLRENHLFICLPGGGQNRFFFSGKRKQRFWTPKKKRVDRWKSWGGAVQPDVGFVLLWYPSGEGLWGILLFPAARV